MKIKYWIAGTLMTGAMLTAFESSFAMSTQVSHNSGSPSMFIASDAWQKFSNATPAQRAKYCPANNGRAKNAMSLRWVPDVWPEKVDGFNSRMDNFRTVYGAKPIDTLSKLFPGFVMLSVSNNLTENYSKALDILVDMAEQNAYLETVNCTDGRGNMANCEMAWKRKDGQDIAPIKDYSMVQTKIVKIEWNYKAFLRQHATSAQKATIDAYFDKWKERQRSYKTLWFGLHMGYLWNEIDTGFNPTSTMRSAIAQLTPMVKDDGSLEGRTNRGNRALWYHQDGLNSTLATMEMARHFGVPIPQKLVDNVEKAAEVWIRGYKDHSFLDKWAKEENMGVHTPGKQDYNKDAKRQDSSNSWFYLFMYRYPDSPLVAEIEELLAGDYKNAIYDRKIGIGLGCIYGTASQFN